MKKLLATILAVLLIISSCNWSEMAVLAADQSEVLSNAEVVQNDDSEKKDKQDGTTEKNNELDKSAESGNNAAAKEAQSAEAETQTDTSVNSDKDVNEKAQKEDKISAVKEDVSDTASQKAESTEEENKDAESDPDAKEGLTRGEWLHDLVETFQIASSKEDYPDNYYPDVTESNSYYGDIMSAINYGMIDIEAGDNLNPDHPLTRDFAAHTLNYCMNYSKKEDSYTFGDSAAVAHPDDAQVALDEGWMQLRDGKFDPEREVTSDEVATMLSAAKDFRNRTTYTEAVSKYQFADYVIQIPDTVNFDLDTEKSNVTLHDYDGTISEGDTFEFQSNGIAYIYKAVSVEKSGSDLIIKTEEADTSALVSGEFAGGFDPSIMDAQPDRSTIVSKDTLGRRVKIGPARVASISKKEISLTRSISVGNITGSINGKINNIHAEPILNTTDRFASLELTGDIAITSTLECTMDDQSLKIPFGTVGLEKVGAITVGLDVNASASITYVMNQQFKIGISCNKGKFSNTSSLSQKDGGNTFSAKGKIQAQLMVSADLDLGIVVKGDAGIGAGPVINVNYDRFSEGTPKECMTISGYLAAGASANVKVLNGLFSESKSWDFYTESNSPVRMYEHWEDGVKVDKCTRGVQKAKYLTPSTSRYWSSTNSNAKSTSELDSSGKANVIWTTTDNADGTVTVTGYNGTASILYIPETIDGKTVTIIGSYAFQNKKDLYYVTIPETVTSIENGAFSGCTSLQKIDIPGSVTTVCFDAFRDDSALSSVTLHDGLVTLRSGAFGNCDALTSIVIPSTVTQEGGVDSIHNSNGPFVDCDNLKKAVIAEGAEKVGYMLFDKCTGLEEVTIPDSVTQIAYYAFHDCDHLKEITIPNSVTQIAYQAFYDCDCLKEINLPGSVTQIGDAAFENCKNLESVVISENIVRIGSDSFAGDINLKNVKILENIAGTTEIGERAFRGCTSLQKVDIPGSVTTVCFDAFRDDSVLSSVTLHDGLVTLRSGAFGNCDALTSIVIPSTVTQEGGVDSIHNSNGPFVDCDNLKKAVIAEGAEKVGYMLFDKCTGLEEVTIPDSVTQIADYAFLECKNIKEINMPDSVAGIGYGAFCGDSSLERVRFSKTLTEIPDSAFTGCKALTKVELPESVKKIGNYVFQNCTALTDIVFGENTETLGNSVCQGDKALKNSTIGNKVTSIGSYAFSECATLEKIVIPDSVTKLGDYAFYQDRLLKEVMLSKNLSEISSHCFDNCRGLEKIVIPKGVKRINDHAFYQDFKLVAYTLPITLAEIGTEAINYPTKLTIYGCKGSWAESWANKNKVKQFVDITKPITEMKLANNADFVHITPGTRFKPEIVCIPEDNTDVLTYASDNRNIVSVNDDGTLYANQNGTVTLTATASSGKQFKLNVVVGKLISLSLTSAPDKTKYKIGEKLDTTGMKLSAVYEDNIVESVTGGFTCTPSEFKKAGKQNVVVTFGDKNVSFEVTVTDPSENDIKIEITPKKAEIARGDTRRFTAKVTGKNDPDTSVVWKVSDNTSKGTTISKDGLLKIGKDERSSRLKVTATSNADPSKSATATVTVRLFKDVNENQYYNEAVSWGAENSVISGYSESDGTSTFRPDDVCTRAQFVTFLWRAMGSQKPKNTKNPFSDIKDIKSVYFSDAVLWSYENGYVSGYSDPKGIRFGGDDEVTRGQVVTFLWRAAGTPKPSSTKSPFTDVKNPSGQYYGEAMLWASENGIVSGYSDPKGARFAPNDPCTRGQVVTFLYRYAQKFLNK